VTTSVRSSAPTPEAGQPRYTIAEVAARSGMSADTLRYYERIGLIDPPARNSAGRRAYRPEDLDWLGFLNRMRDTGIPLRALREYAALRRVRTESTTARRKQILVEYRRDVQRRMAQLQSSLDALDYKIGNYEQVERKLAAVSPAEDR
jgi:DNA-binding transcriptional MerR regulator